MHLRAGYRAGYRAADRPAVVAVTDASLFSAEYEDSLRILGETCGVSERAKTVTEFINSVIADLRARTENIPDDDKPSILAAAATFKGSHGIEGVYSNYAVFDVISVNDVTRAMMDASCPKACSWTRSRYWRGTRT